MKLRKLSLSPFAGFSRREFSFAPGLNVFLGANDAGKSTVFRAIDSAFFLPSKASRSTREGRDLLPRVLPLGSDQARVCLEFDGVAGAFRLEKTWGQSASVSLEGPSGLRLSQDEKVEEALRGLLPVPPATFQSVLLMGQGALEGTVAALEAKRESLHSLGDLLRLTVDKTAGISVDRLKHLLASEIERAFQHWDRMAGLPEKGKGIEDPWVKNVGTVLAAYYARERSRRDSRLAQELESERDRKLADLNARQAKREASRSFVKANEKFVESVAIRQTLETKREKAAGEADAKVADLNAWLQANSRRELFAPEVERLEASRKNLDDELNRALGQSKKRELLARFERLTASRSARAEAEARLKALPVLKPEDLKRLRLASQEVEGIRTGLKAGKLQLQFTVRKDLEVVMRKDLDPERKGLMPAGKPMTLNAGGRIQLSSEYFELQVTSGDGKLAELEEQLAAKNAASARLLAELKVQSLEEAVERSEKFTDAAAALKAAEGTLSALLGTDKFEDLERQLLALESSGLGREPELIRAELLLVAKELEGKRDSLVRSQSLIQDLERRHGVASSEALTAQMLQKKTELADLEKQINALPELPPQVGRLEEFVARFQSAKTEIDLWGDEIRDLSVALEGIKARLRSELDDQSAQDIERASREAAGAFERALAHGNALLRVEAAVKTVEGAGTDIYGDFRSSFEKQVLELSQGKYLSAKMQESLPTDFRRSDGAAVPYGWLSAGTKDAFALALRLAMADHFLGRDDGFLLVDDPLVNMDPGRQKIAAGMLREFASRRQVVVFTCHPAHAELLGGSCVSL